MSIIAFIPWAIIVGVAGYEVYKHRTAPTVAKALGKFEKLAQKLEAAVTHHSSNAANAQAVATSEAANAAKASNALAAVKTITQPVAPVKA